MNLTCNIVITYKDCHIETFEDVLHFEYRAAFVLTIWKDLFIPIIISLKDVSNIKVLFE